MDWLPPWVRAVGVAVFLVAGGQHLWHAAAMDGARRFWHLGHALMAAGMVVMYWAAAEVFPAGVGVAVFGAAAVVYVGGGAGLAIRDGSWNPLWLASAVEMAAMVYMFAPPGSSSLLAEAFVLYFLVQAVAWAGGWWGRYQVADRPVLAFAGPGGRSGAPVAAEVSSPTAALSATCSLWLRASLAAMALGMGYMLLVM